MMARRVLRTFAIGLSLAGVADFAGAQVAQIAEMALVTDTAIPLAGLEGLLDDRGAVRERLAAGSERRRLMGLPALPDGVAIAALEYGFGGILYFALDGWVDLPGAGLVGPLDVVRSTGGSFERVFDGVAAGVPPNAAIDAIGWVGLGAVQVALSFDVALAFAGELVPDAELAIFTEGEFDFRYGISLVVPPGLDIDGLSLVPGGGVAVSFDTSGVIGDVTFDDEDILRWNSGVLSLLVHMEALSSSWRSANLEAFALLGSYIFADDLELGSTIAWSDTVP